jgi:hypothetical protein
LLAGSEQILGEPALLTDGAVVFASENVACEHASCTNISMRSGTIDGGVLTTRASEAVLLLCAMDPQLLAALLSSTEKAETEVLEEEDRRVLLPALLAALTAACIGPVVGGRLVWLQLSAWLVAGSEVAVAKESALASNTMPFARSDTIR